MANDNQAAWVVADGRTYCFEIELGIRIALCVYAKDTSCCCIVSGTSVTAISNKFVLVTTIDSVPFKILLCCKTTNSLVFIPAIF